MKGEVVEKVWNILRGFLFLWLVFGLAWCWVVGLGCVVVVLGVGFGSLVGLVL